MVAAKGEDGKRLIAHAKSNIGPEGSGFVYDLQQGPLPGRSDMMASSMRWGNTMEGTAQEMLAEAEISIPGQSAADEAIQWLLDTLETSSMTAGAVMKLARLSGISGKALRTARERIGIKPKREGFGKGSTVRWSLPSIDAQPPHRCPLTERASMQQQDIYGKDSGM